MYGAPYVRPDIPGPVNPDPGPDPSDPSMVVVPGVARAGWPAKGTLDYMKVGLELLLLLLAVPWILRELTRHPGSVSRKAAAKHLSG